METTPWRHSDCVIICVSIRIDGTFLSRLVEAGLENPAYPKLHGIMTQPHCAERKRRSNLKRLLRSLAMTPMFWFFFCAAAFAQQLSPAQILQKVDEVRNPQEDYTIVAEVSSFSSSRRPKSATYEVMVKGKDKTIVKTIRPQIEYGRLLLMRDRDLWAFFPEVTKPLRLSMQERLIGDVSNGDVARANFTGDYTPSLLREEKIGGKDCYVLELSAASPEVTYGKVLLWAEKENYWPRKAEFYAISGRLIKRCSYESYKMLAERMRPTELVMEDPIVKGKKSTIQYNNIQLGELPEKYFSKEYMKKLMQ